MPDNNERNENPVTNENAGSEPATTEPGRVVIGPRPCCTVDSVGEVGNCSVCGWVKPTDPDPDVAGPLAALEHLVGEEVRWTVGDNEQGETLTGVVQSVQVNGRSWDAIVRPRAVGDHQPVDQVVAIGFLDRVAPGVHHPVRADLGDDPDGDVAGYDGPETLPGPGMTVLVDYPESDRQRGEVMHVDTTTERPTYRVRMVEGPHAGQELTMVLTAKRRLEVPPASDVERMALHQQHSRDGRVFGDCLACAVHVAASYRPGERVRIEGRRDGYHTVMARHEGDDETKVAVVVTGGGRELIRPELLTRAFIAGDPVLWAPNMSTRAEWAGVLHHYHQRALGVFGPVVLAPMKNEVRHLRTADLRLMLVTDYEGARAREQANVATAVDHLIIQAWECDTSAVLSHAAPLSWPPPTMGVARTPVRGEPVLWMDRGELHAGLYDSPGDLYATVTQVHRDGEVGAEAATGVESELLAVIDGPTYEFAKLVSATTGPESDPALIVRAFDAANKWLRTRNGHSVGDRVLWIEPETREGDAPLPGVILGIQQDDRFVIELDPPNAGREVVAEPGAVFKDHGWRVGDAATYRARPVRVVELGRSCLDIVLEPTQAEEGENPERFSVVVGSPSLARLVQVDGQSTEQQGGGFHWPGFERPTWDGLAIGSTVLATAGGSGHWKATVTARNETANTVTVQYEVGPMTGQQIGGLAAGDLLLPPEGAEAAGIAGAGGLRDLLEGLFAHAAAKHQAATARTLAEPPVVPAPLAADQLSWLLTLVNAAVPSEPGGPMDWEGMGRNYAVTMLRAALEHAHLTADPAVENAERIARMMTLPGLVAFAAERTKQIVECGHTPDHDREHEDGELLAAAMYWVTGQVDYWPWGDPPIRGADPVRWIRKAGGFLAAEFDRLSVLDPLERSLACRVCGCTHFTACETPAGRCGWVEGEADLCTGCAQAGDTDDTNEELANFAARGYTLDAPQEPPMWWTVEIDSPAKSERHTWVRLPDDDPRVTRVERRGVSRNRKGGDHDPQWQNPGDNVRVCRWVNATQPHRWAPRSWLELFVMALESGSDLYVLPFEGGDRVTATVDGTSQPGTLRITDGSLSFVPDGTPVAFHVAAGVLRHVDDQRPVVVPDTAPF